MAIIQQALLGLGAGFGGYTFGKKRAEDAQSDPEIVEAKLNQRAPAAAEISADGLTITVEEVVDGILADGESLGLMVFDVDGVLSEAVDPVEKTVSSGWISFTLTSAAADTNVFMVYRKKDEEVDFHLISGANVTQLS